ncbi:MULTISPECIES: hypothetical protein [Pseudoalteromonas]|uniref:Uncharacterized protein n=1 Tax=Pseudoalteromonas amylolytica TaxID=1859457 RepID=A0A1S1MVH1_9GAMM|nr:MULTISPECIES: hypothetical protein [Pseudoalteromonas]MCF6433949.1 hypothetical protein [Pseudoalteromonas sp. MMG022]OHU88132.1 hypothetical protein BFC16_12135 [Pseudoalteromonas sp. JW3]OHU91572.1 hypothetical protein BET10_12255 [Pseudoalteromonas amylolytica]
MQLKKKAIATAFMALSLSLVALVGVSKQSETVNMTKLSDAKPYALLSGRSQKGGLEENNLTIESIFNFFFS